MGNEMRKEREDRREGREQRKEADRGVGERKGGRSRRGKECVGV